MKQFTLLFLSLLTLTGVAKDVKITPDQYINTYKGIAIREMKRTGIPASITLSQGILESGCGNSKLARKANNHFGIKCHSDWTGPSMRKDDDKKNECFRKYKTAEQSYVDHSDFLVNRSRYAALFQLKPTDYKGWAKGLKKAGYATNPKYPKLLIDLIEKYQLNQFDKGNAKVKKAPKSQEEKTKVKSKSKVKDKSKKKDKSKPKDDGGTGVVQVSGRVKQTGNLVKYVVVQKGESLEDISKEFRVSVSRLLRYNERSSRKVNVGERIYIQPKRKNAKEKYYKVKSGDSLYRISQLFGVSQKSLIKRNRLGLDGKVMPGQRLKLAGSKVKQ